MQELGIVDIELYRIRIWLERMQRSKEFKIARAAHIKLAIMQISNSSRSILMTNPKYLENHTEYKQFQELLKVSFDEIKSLEEKIEIGQFIYEKLVVAPWNTTETYVKSHIERGKY